LSARSLLTTPQTLDAASLTQGERRAMFALYERYYDASSWDLFARDLAAKDRVIVLRDEAGALQGFSTLALYERTFAGRRARVIFSGDTIVDESHWGQQALAGAWLAHAGAVKAEQPDVPLYWLLISKGHRTYRYLPTFSLAFHPSPDGPHDPALAALRDFLARDRFGEDFDADAGVVRFPESRGHLRDDFADVPEAHRRLPAVQFFLACNPGYARGDELVCVCELALSNLRPVARRAFASGMRAALAA
jgi:hypothetical protein